MDILLKDPQYFHVWDTPESIQNGYGPLIILQFNRDCPDGFEILLGKVPVHIPVIMLQHVSIKGWIAETVTLDDLYVYRITVRSREAQIACSVEKRVIPFY